ncbi:uncharacterized protein LY89DRAFT_690843 [Mollisia scopiformis]|uniref:Uncharacterized protein n=1 Tax=Mollisia scopiformis TaxID=149040 RepID=A0A132B8Y9_MOLSC|nr:uncharacterized protein LY89DRAFT_690843 [Mollisia scopiformis]KUJ08872.1 hypothetical protein LY89DRAFT_690843 [Mollisia scopiformis]
MGSRHLPLPPLYWGRERGDRPRYDSVTDRYGRPSDFYVGFEDLSIDARGHTSDVRVVDVRTIDPRYLDTRTSPSGRGYQGHLESNFPNHRDREPRLRSAMSSRKSSVSFGRGMKKLSRVLTKSEEYFSQFIGDFDQDMNSTEKYATLEIQEQLWRLKVAGKRDKRTIKDDQNHQEEDGEKPKKKFEEKRKDLIHALQLALTVRLDEDRDTSKAKARIETANRLQDKIRVANDQISELLDKSTKDRDHCGALLNEIRLLKNLIDPEMDGNKDLFKVTDGEPDGASDAEEEGRGSGREAWEN